MQMTLPQGGGALEYELHIDVSFQRKQYGKENGG